MLCFYDLKKPDFISYFLKFAKKNYNYINFGERCTFYNVGVAFHVFLTSEIIRKLRIS